MTKRAYGRYIDYIAVESENVMVEIRVLESKIEINGEKVLTNKWLLPECWQEVLSILHEAARRHIKDNYDNVLKILGKSVCIVLNFDTFLPAYQYILKPYKSNTDNLEECLNNSGSDWLKTSPYEFMMKAVVSPVNSPSNSLSTSSHTSESDTDKRLKNNTEIIDETNIKDTQVSESDNELNSVTSNKLSSSFLIPESDSDNSLPDYSHINPIFDSQDMCCIEKISKYTGLPSKKYIYKENMVSSQYDNSDNLNVLSSQAKCLNDEKIATKSKTSKHVRSKNTLFDTSSHSIGKLDFRSRNKTRKTTKVEELNAVDDNISGHEDKSSLKIDKKKITYSSSQEFKGNENEADILLKRVLVKHHKNQKKKCKIRHINKSQETKTASYSPEKSSEVSEQHDKKCCTVSNFDADRKKSRIFQKKKYDNSEIKSYFPKISSENTRINTGPTVGNSSNEEYIPQTPDFMRLPVYQKCKSSSLENFEYLSPKTKKHLKLKKKFRDISENNLSKISCKKTKSHHERLSRKVKEKLCLNVASSTGPFSKSIQSYFSPISTKQSISDKYSRKENINSQISSEKMSLSRSLKSNKNDLKEIEEFTNTVEDLEKECMHHVSHSSEELLNQECINLSSENLPNKTKKNLKLSKTLRTKSEDNVNKETKFHHQRPKRKVREKSDLNAKSKVGSSSKNIQSYFSPDFLNTDQSILGKCARKENLNSQISPENISVSKPSLSNENHFEEFEHSSDCHKKVMPNKRQIFSKNQSPSKCSISQNGISDETTENNEVCSEIMKERKKYRVAHLSLDEIENEYAKHENYLNEIFTGKQTTSRHEQFCKGGPASQTLRFSVSTIPFTDKQLNHLLILMRQTLCHNRNFIPYFDYFMKVLLPEVTTRIFMNMFSLSHDEVLNKLNELYISTNEPLMFGT